MYIPENQELGRIIAMPSYGLSSNLHGLGDISPTDYINWVKRSLNRRFNAKLPMGRSTDPAYQQAVKRFQSEVGLNASGEVDSATQNQLIKANESDSNYMEWVQKALNKTGAELTISRRKDKSTLAAIRGFQAYHTGVYKDLKIKVDGFIGAKTETALIRATQTLPPGHLKGSQPKPTIDYDAALINQLKKAEDTILEFPSLKGSKDTLCLIRKLLNERVEDRFIDKKRMDEYFLKSTPKQFYFLRAKRTLKDKLARKWQRNEQVSVDEFIAFIDQLKRDMLEGMNIAHFELSGTYIYDKQRKMAVKRVFDLLVGNQKSLYSCDFAVAHYQKIKKSLFGIATPFD